MFPLFHIISFVIFHLFSFSSSFVPWSLIHSNLLSFFSSVCFTFFFQLIFPLTLLVLVSMITPMSLSFPFCVFWLLVILPSYLSAPTCSYSDASGLCGSRHTRGGLLRRPPPFPFVCLCVLSLFTNGLSAASVPMKSYENNGLATFFFTVEATIEKCVRKKNSALGH